MRRKAVGWKVNGFCRQYNNMPALSRFTNYGLRPILFNYISRLSRFGKVQET